MPFERLSDPALLRRLLRVVSSVVSELDLEAVLAHVVDEAVEITGARYGALGVLNERRDGLARFITRGIDEDMQRTIGNLPHGRGVLGVLISEPKALRLPDVGSHPRSYGFPPGHPEMHAFLGVPITVRGEAWGNLYLTEKEGGQQFSDADEQAVLTLAQIAGIAIDNANLYERVEARREELERAVTGFEATTQIALAVGAETDIDRVLELIAKRGRALVGARSLAILLEDGGELRISAVAGEADRGSVGQVVALDHSPYGSVYRSGQPERVTDLTRRLDAEPDMLGVHAVTALLVPLVFKGVSVGVLAAFDRYEDDGGFTSEHEHLLLSFAASAATAVSTAQSVAEDRLRHSIEAAEQERRRWARELHDDTLQGLAGLNVLLQSGLAAGGASLERAASQATRQIEEQIAALRTLITDLRPAVLDELGLVPAIETLAARVGVVEGLEIEHDLDLDGARLAPEIESTLYRLVQEALTNVGKHARAERVWITLQQSGGNVEVEVRDDGLGFDPAAPKAGFGLTGMRERVALAGGQITIRSAPDEGTTLSAMVPARHVSQAVVDHAASA